MAGYNRRASSSTGRKTVKKKATSSSKKKYGNIGIPGHAGGPSRFARKYPPMSPKKKK